MEILAGKAACLNILFRRVTNEPYRGSSAEQPYSEFTLYFLAYDESDGTSTSGERNQARFRREGRSARK